MSGLLGNALAAYAVWRAWRTRRQRWQWIPANALAADFDVRRLHREMLARVGVDPEEWLR